MATITEIANPPNPVQQPVEQNEPAPNQTSLEEIERQKIVHKTKFAEWLNSTRTATSKSTSKMLGRERAESIIRVLREIDKPTANFKQFIKKNQYNIIIEDDTGNPILHKVATRKNHTNNLPVALKENFFDILYSLHSVQRGHTGIGKTEEDVRIRYYGIPRAAITKFINFCPICNLKKIQTGQPRLHPIRSNDFNERSQLDLIDMRHNPCKIGDKIYNWIAHWMDHYAKLHVIWAQEQKTAIEVTNGLRCYVLAYFGLPRILQCDNGTEFKNELMRNLISNWDGSEKIK
jgi:hypothetical protein